MNFRTLASGSSGNCYLLETTDGSLLIEAGIPINRIKKALNYDFSNIYGCLVSHEHGDHAKAIKDIADMGIDVYSSKGTFKALGCTGHRFIPMAHGKAVTIDKLDILPFKTEHDSVEPLGFLIRHKDKRLLFATDTFYLRYRFNNLTHIAIECNYVRTIIDEKIKEGSINARRIARTLKSHMSLENLLEFLRINDLSRVEEMHLLHLSNENSDIEVIKEEIRKIYKGNLVIAG